MFGLSPLPLYAVVFLLCTNGVTGIMWYVKASDARSCQTARASDQTRARLAAAEAALEEAEASIARNNRALAQVAAQEADIERLTKEKNNALQRLTVGRRCLDGAAVRVLNGPAVPAAVADAVPAAAAFATDSDVGEWIAGAQRAYDTCRARVDGIAAFYAGAP